MRKTLCSSALILLFQLLLSGSCLAQEVPQVSVKIENAIELARQHYPSLRAAQAQAQAAEAGIESARTAYLPRTELIWQQNIATRNNIFGLLLPQSMIPSISGPVLDETSPKGVWGSAAGMLFSWEPVDFGLRKANVGVARAMNSQAEAAITLTQFDISVAAADAFLTALAAQQTVLAAQAGIERAAALLRTVRALVDNQLRPGVDVSRAEAEQAAAKNQLIQAQQNAELARLSLAEAIGQPGASMALDPGPLLELPQSDGSSTPVDLSSHPLARMQNAAIETVKARERALDRAYFPRFNFQTAVFGRGSGALLNGKFDYGKGFYPDTGNWAVGVTLSFPLFDIFGIRARKKIEAGHEAAERARYDQVVQALKTQGARARTLVESARRMAENTPVQLKAAQETLTRAKARYEHGLANIVEIADAQRLLAQAEIDDAVARLTVWRAMLAAARLQGDLKSFLEKAAKK